MLDVNVYWRALLAELAAIRADDESWGLPDITEAPCGLCKTRRGRLRRAHPAEADLPVRKGLGLPPLEAERRSPGGRDGFTRPVVKMEREPAIELLPKSPEPQPLARPSALFFFLEELNAAPQGPARLARLHRETPVVTPRPSTVVRVRADIRLAQHHRRLSDSRLLKLELSAAARNRGLSLDDCKSAFSLGRPTEERRRLRREVRDVILPFYEGETEVTKLKQVLGVDRSSIYRLMGDTYSGPVTDGFEELLSLDGDQPRAPSQPWEPKPSRTHHPCAALRDDDAKELETEEGHLVKGADYGDAYDDYVTLQDDEWESECEDEECSDSDGRSDSHEHDADEAIPGT